MGNKPKSSQTKEVSDLLIKFDTGTGFNQALYNGNDALLNEKNKNLKEDISQKLTKLALEKAEHFNAIFTSKIASRILTNEDFSVLYAQLKDGKNFAHSEKAQKNFKTKLLTCKDYINDQIALFKKAEGSSKQTSQEHSAEANAMFNFFSSSPTSPRSPSTPPLSPSSSSKVGLSSISEGVESADPKKKTTPK